jgi:hypothetical protein
MMKKLLSLLIVLLIVITPTVFAADIKTVDASEDSSGKITVKGTADDSMVAVAVSLYEEDGTFIKVVTGSVEDDNTYEVTINMEAKKYIVRVADYNGGNYIEKEVSPNTTDETEDTTTTVTEEVTPVKSPKTFDAILIAVSVLVISVVGIAVSARYFVKRKEK